MTFANCLDLDAHGGLRLSSLNATNTSFATQAKLPIKYSLNNYEINQTGITMIIETTACHDKQGTDIKCTLFILSQKVGYRLKDLKSESVYPKV